MLTGRTTGFALEHSYARGVHVLRAAGQLVVGAGADHPAWGLTSEIHGAAPVVIDLRDVTALDARGVGRLLGLRGALARHGARLTLHAAGPRVRRVLRLTRVDALLGISPDSSSGGPSTPPAAAPDWPRCA